ncbi:MAG: N-acetylmuramoyl-L-alanine amidase [Lachnospiraceae bacterium]|nr:N-acetylmuramoyl-L-alanine amidase [Lachnospiraceae bacterium]
MKKRAISMAMTIIFIISMCVLAKTAAIYTMSDQLKEKERVVVIDPGHGGNDPGKVGVNDVLEKDINLKIALLVKVFLEQDDIRVILTRDGDYGLYGENDKNKKVMDIKKRVEIIETPGTALAVSIHQNSYGAGDITGAQVFYFTHSEEGKKAAEIMQDQLITGVDPSNHRKAKANNNYYILKKSTVPSIIVECGFLSSQTEAALLCEEEYQEKLAWNIHLAIIKYLNQD